MKLASLAVFAALAATPALAASDYPDTAAAPDPSVDSQIAAKDQARQNYYQHKLEAAAAQTQKDNAEAQADQAAAQRDEALNKADDDRSDIEAAKR